MGSDFRSRQYKFSLFLAQVMAVIADFMLVYLPAPTVSLRPPLALNAGRLAKFFHGCPDNAFQVTSLAYCFTITWGITEWWNHGLHLMQVALRGSSYSLLQRIGAIVVGYLAYIFLSGEKRGKEMLELHLTCFDLFSHSVMERSCLLWAPRHPW